MELFELNERVQIPARKRGRRTKDGSDGKIGERAENSRWDSRSAVEWTPGYPDILCGGIYDREFRILLS